jgi:hypothetical protein
MEVPDDAVGKQTACPSCQHAFLIQAAESSHAPSAGDQAPAPPADPPEAPAPPEPQSPEGQIPHAAPVPADRPSQTPRKKFGFRPLIKTRSIKQMGLWRYLAFGACCLAIGAFLLPWWSGELRGDLRDLARRSQGRLDPWSSPGFRDAQREWARVEKVQADDEDFYDDRMSEQEKDKAEKFEDLRALARGVELELEFFGWQFWQGIVSVILAILALGLLSVVMFAPATRRFGWAMTGPAALMGVAVLILSLVMILSAPGGDYTGQYFEISQTVREGAYVSLAGGAMLAAFAAVDLVLGLTGRQKPQT